MSKILTSIAVLSASVAFLPGVPSSAGTASDARPIFTYLPSSAPNHKAPVHPASQLAQWNGSFIDLTGRHVTYTMIGTDPATNNAPTAAERRRT
ncbi:MAG TPA: hypothetical protein VHU23_06300 [Rhizomicrobium sp.]|nr:hypothetical protein [Rhizomicrobium sp.]